jgi:cytochrome P450
MNLVTELDLPELDYTEQSFGNAAYHARLAELRRLTWLAHSPLAYLILEREPGELFLRSRATAFPGREIAAFFGITSGPLAEHIDQNLLNTSGDQHRRLRSLAGPAFGPRAVDEWRPLMRHALARLWPARTGACEFVETLARPYAARVIAAILGAPAADAEKLHDWSELVQLQFNPAALATSHGRIENAVAELTAYAGKLVDRPQNVIKELFAARADGGMLSRDECLNLVVNLIAGGIDTVRGQLSLAARLFAEHPAQWEMLAFRPGLVPRAVSEVLRYEPAAPFTARICLRDVECRGVLFPAGTVVAVCAERANRETAGGEDFDITAEREDPILTFGAGPHACLGASLARAELEEALAYLAPRAPGLALDGAPVAGGVTGVYGLEKLPVRWRRPAEPMAAGFRSIRCD